jgi:hypothetical protein
MPDTTQPYIKANPGDLITAENWNAMQTAVRQDIATQISSAVAGVKDVNHAKNSDEVGGMSLAELTKYILDQALAQIPKRTGYMQVFCNLALNVDKIIQHNLKAYPLVDVYQLDYFQMVCARNDTPEDAQAEYGLFYLYHADERRLRIPKHTDAIDIETDPKFRILWKTLIDQFLEQKLLDYTDDTTLDDLEVDFWEAMFKSPPNDQFDPDAYCHSPWFEKCCGEKRTVGDLRKHGDFDDIYLKVMPRKTINCPVPTATDPKPEPTNVRVSHLDPNNVLLNLLLKPVFPSFPTSNTTGGTEIMPPQDTNKLPLMVLLKV